MKNKSLHRQFIDWWDDYSKDKWYLTKNGNNIIYILFLFIFFSLIYIFDPVWRPFLNHYYPDYIPLLDYEPYSP